APGMARVRRSVGQAAIRSRGPGGGSLANADPAAEIALVAVTLGATLMYRQGAASAEMPASDFFVGPMMTALPATACLTAVRFPRWRDARIGVGFHEVSARRSDFAFASAAAQVALDDDGVCRRLALGGAGRWGWGRGRPAGCDWMGGRRRLRGRAWSRPLRARRCVRRSPASSRFPTCTRRRTTAGARRRALPCMLSPMLAGPPRPRMRVELIVNGEMRTVEVEPRMSLLDCLRERLLLTGAHAGCEHGVGGACTVLIDCAPGRSWLMFAGQAGGHGSTPIDGGSPGRGALSASQDGFWGSDGIQGGC